MSRKPKPESLAALIAHNKARAADWDSVDWTLDNRTIAQQLGRAYDTVARKRVQLGKSGMAAQRAPRRFCRPHYPNMKRADTARQAATEAAKISPKAGRAATNVHAKHWRLISPTGVVYEFHNLHHFVRNHGHLFAPEDTIWKWTGGKRGTGGEYCNATAGISNIIRGIVQSWKGWQAEQISAT